MRARHTLRSLMFAAALAAAACDENLTLATDPTPTTSVEDSFTSQLVPGGTATRAINVTTRGAVSITLSATTPAGTIVGLGIGIPQANGAGCTLNTSLETTAGSAPQLTVTVESGTYCAKVFDVGHLTTSAVLFTLLFSRP